MKRYGMSVCAFLSLGVLSLPCVAQDSSQNNAWNGSWKIDRATMKYDGPTAIVAADAEGYTLTFGGETRPKVRCDGKPNPPVDGLVTTCNKVGTGYEVENTRDGKPVSKGKVELSPGGRSLTRTMEITPTEGDPFTFTTTSKKVSGGDGLSGTWKETSFTESQDTGVLTIQVHGDSIDFKETDNDKPITCKLDGSPVAMGMQSMSIKQDGSRTLKVTYSDNGKVQRENSFVLSSDGQSIQETDVTPAPMASTMTVTLRKS